MVVFFHRRKGIKSKRALDMSVISAVNKEEAVMIAGESAMQHDISNGDLEFTVKSTPNWSIGISKQSIGRLIIALIDHHSRHRKERATAVHL